MLDEERPSRLAFPCKSTARCTHQRVAFRTSALCSWLVRLDSCAGHTVNTSALLHPTFCSLVPSGHLVLPSLHTGRAPQTRASLHARAWQKPRRQITQQSVAANVKTSDCVLSVLPLRCYARPPPSVPHGPMSVDRATVWISLNPLARFLSKSSERMFSRRTGKNPGREVCTDKLLLSRWAAGPTVAQAPRGDTQMRGPDGSGRDGFIFRPLAEGRRAARCLPFHLEQSVCTS